MDSSQIRAFLSGDLGAMAEKLWSWLLQNALTWQTLSQLGFAALALIAAYFIQRALSPQLESLGQRLNNYILKDALRRLRLLITPLLAMLLVWLGYAVMNAQELPNEILRIIANLLTAWVVIRLVSSFLRSVSWAMIVSVLIWIVAALAILGWIEPAQRTLDSLAYEFGEMRISLLAIINGLVLLVIFLFVSNFIVRIIEARMRYLDVSPTARVLLVKLLRIIFITIAVVVVMTSIGIDLTAIAIFSGAVGIGVGFGLQKVVSNLLSGILLLLDRSLKPGDVIEIGDAYGWISRMGARYITVATRDGKEYLIPNEDIITQQVINWSYSDRAIRIRIKVGISYRSDVRKAMQLMSDAAAANTRVLNDSAHKPQVRLVDFGDSSVNLELRIWVLDPEQGMMNVTSDIRLAIWDAFHENGIEFPFPQRDLHISSAPGLEKLAEKWEKER